MSHHWIIEENNFLNDRRVLALNNKSIFSQIDLRKKTAVVTLEDENYNKVFHTVPIHFVVCPLCEGSGKHVNPSIDCNGLTSEDFCEDPDFAEEYMRGRYDVTCYQCKGKNVIPAIQVEKADPEVIRQLVEREESREEFRRLQESERRMGA